MFKKRKVLIAVSALCAAAAVVSGCGEKKEDASSGEFSGTLTYWVAMPSQISANYTSMKELPQYIEMEKRTGVHIDFVHAPVDQEQEKFTLMIASNNLTDMVETNWKRYYQGGLSKALQDGMIISFNEYLDEYAPNFKKLMEENSETRCGLVTSNGDYCSFPGVRRSDEASKNAMRTNFGGMYIRKDWLDKCNLPVPETIEEWETTLRAFKEQLGVKHPLIIESGWFKAEGNGNDFNNAFGVDKGWFVKDGKVKFGPAEPGYKDYVATMNKWYNEGLLSNEFDTISSATTISEFIKGNVGAAYGFISSSMGGILSSAELSEGFDIAGTQYPVLNKGDEPYFMTKASFVSTPFLTVTKACKHPEEAIKWADYLFSEEGALLNYFGVEGETYTRVDDTHVAYTDAIMNQDVPPGTALAKYVRGFTSCPGVSPIAQSTISKYNKPQMQEAYELYNKYIANVFEVQMPEFEYSIEMADNVSALEFDINSYVYENVIRYIKGAEPMSNYDKFVNDLKSLKLDELIEIKQQAYDAYMKN